MAPRSHLLDDALARLEAGAPLALATVIETWGSSPRPVGSEMFVTEAGEMQGSVSGGCIESSVVAEAQAVLQNGAPKVLEFGVSDDRAWQVGLSCGGRIKVFVERLDPADEDLLAQLREIGRVRQERRQVAWLRDLESGARRLETGKAPLEAGRREFCRTYEPAVRLVIIGAVHVAQELVTLAERSGLDVVVVDPRRAWASAERFGAATLCHDWPDEALRRLKPDRRTAVAVLCHDPKIDDPGLVAALDSEAFYIGALGSRRTHERRLARLAEQGWSAAQLARIHGPIGLDIGARGPVEIALAILAQIVQEKNRLAATS